MAGPNPFSPCGPPGFTRRRALVLPFSRREKEGPAGEASGRMRAYEPIRIVLNRP
jgi:hypothetical protein